MSNNVRFLYIMLLKMKYFARPIQHYNSFDINLYSDEGRKAGGCSLLPTYQANK